MNQTYLKVMSITNGEDKTKVPFKAVVFEEVQLIGKREAKVASTATRIFWPAKYERLVNGVKTVFSGYAGYDMLAVGDIFAGHLFFCETTPYQLNQGGQYIRTWKGAVLYGENDLVVAAKSLRQNGGAKPLYRDEDTDEMVPFTLPATATTPNPSSANEQNKPVVDPIVTDNQP